MRTTLSVCFGLVALMSIGATLEVQGAVNCSQQEQVLSGLKLTEEPARGKFVSKFAFDKDKKPSLLITWAGPNSKVLIVATLKTRGLKTLASDVYRSTDDGRTFATITPTISKTSLLVDQRNGLQRGLADTSRIYIVAQNPIANRGSLLHVSRDGGATWKLAELNFQLTVPIMFHPTNPDLLMAVSMHKAFVSTDGGDSWKPLKNGIYRASWAEPGDTEPSGIYVAYDKSLESPMHRFISLIGRRTTRKLLKTGDFGATWRTLADSIYSFKNKGPFVYISRTAGSSKLRHLLVSIDYGVKFNRVSLPAVPPSKFYSILDVADGLVFVHMDAGNYKGHGTLYTSDASGSVFSPSLKRHLYPPYGSATDFYRVRSMKGAYLATVLHPDSSMHTVITHNRGAVWHPLPKPEGAECKDHNMVCLLQVSSSYSKAHGVPADPPLSLPSAAGVIVAHGHSANALQQSAADVFVSNDGGYTWALALKGPHHVQIANQGGLLVAVPQAVSVQSVKFSTDEGRCWHEYAFTNETFRFTGLLTEPGNRALSAAIWGFVPITKQWRVFVLDFTQVLNRQCSAADYESWLSDGKLNFGSRHRACLLGVKETIKRLKPNSLCANDYNWTASKDKVPCECTKEDFECEYGYTRQVNSLACEKDETVAELDLCDKENVVTLETQGYRKLPGNLCTGGFKPNATRRVISAGRKCPQPTPEAGGIGGKEYIDSVVAKNREAERLAGSQRLKTTVAVVVPLLLTLTVLLCIVLAVIMLARMRERRRRQLAFHYSAVSAAGRTADLPQYRPADEILNPQLPAQRSYSTAGSGDKRLLLEDTDDVEPVM